MITHDLVQGSNEWHQFRSSHYGASEAAAMLNMSPYTTRTELLKEKATGLIKPVDDYTQQVFDNGHRVEALARPIVEAMLGEELYSITCSNGKLSASCDGLTMDESIAWEHKQWNKNLAASVKSGTLPDHHQPQCQQVLLITGATKLIFTVSDGTETNMESMEVLPDQAWFERIKSGWEQFDKDLENYQHVEIIEPPKAEAIKDLPSVTVQVRGELTLCNLNDVTPLFDKFLAEAKTNLLTDDDFAIAEAEAKLGRETAKRCKLTAKAVVDQMLSVSEVTRTLEEYAAKFDALALKQEKAVKEQKEQRKASAKLERDKAYAEHIAALNDEIKPIYLVLSTTDKPDFVGAMKGQRTLASLYNKLDTELARAKIAADAVANDIRGKLKTFNVIAAHHKFLFNDLQNLIYKNHDDFHLALTSRIAAHKIAEAENLASERKRIQAEEEAKAKAAQERQLEAEREKIRMEEAAKAKAEQEAIKQQQQARQAELERINNEMRQPAARVTMQQVDNAIAEKRKREDDLRNPPVIETVTIGRNEYNLLLRDSKLLACLRAAGLESFDIYLEALDMLEKQ
jgi:putative phage-type endonuclease